MLMRFDPFAEFDRFARGNWSEQRQSRFMSADAYRKDDRFWLHIDMPGVDPDSIDLTVEKNTLTIAVERPGSKEAAESAILNERAYGSFSRQFFLGESLDPDHIEAGYDHGVLTVSIPVADVAKPRKIQVGTTHEALTA